MSDYRKFFEQHDKFDRLVDDVLTRNDSIQALLEPSPAMKAVQDTMDRFSSVNSPMTESIQALLEPSPAMKALQDTIDRFADATEPMNERATAVQDSINRITGVHSPLHEQLAKMTSASDAIREFRSVCDAIVPPRIDPKIFEPPVHFVAERPQRLGPAQEVMQIINERFETEKTENEDRWHKVFIIVTLLDGTRIHAEQLFNEGEHLIRVEGKDDQLNSRSVTVGADAIQYEIITIELPPKKPDLRTVN